MQFVGANPDELDALGAQFTNEANQLEAIRNEISSLMSVTSWCGADAESFHGEWSGQLVGLITMVDQALLAAATKLRFEAQQQRSASGIDGGPGGLGLPGLFSGLSGLSIPSGIAVGTLIHDFLGNLGTGVGLVTKFEKLFQTLAPFGDAQAFKTATSVFNAIDKAPEWLAGPARSFLTHLSGLSGVGDVAAVFKTPLGHALPIIGTVISGASVVDDVYNITQGGWTSTNEGNLLSDSGGVLMGIPFPPVMVAGAALMIGSKLDPTWPQDSWRGAQYIYSNSVRGAETIISDTSQGAQTVWHDTTQGAQTVWHDTSQGAQTVWHDTTQVASNIANTGKNIVGGVASDVGGFFSHL